jgi:3-oxoadipate enol-lactonase
MSRVEGTANGIHYAIEGQGPWLALSHSLACNLSMWDEQVAVLARRFKCLRFDTRGNGRSAAPPGPYTLEELADDTKTLFDALGVRKAHWLGLSLGDAIGQVFALAYPGVLESLVLAGTASRYPADAGPMWADRIRAVETHGMEPLVEPTLTRWFTDDFRRTHPERVASIAAAIRATPEAGYIGCGHAIPKLNVTARLKEIACPVLIIVGADDPSTPFAMAQEIHENIPGSELVVIPSAAHLVNIEQPEEFNRALVRFYDRIGIH